MNFGCKIKTSTIQLIILITLCTSVIFGLGMVTLIFRKSCNFNLNNKVLPSFLLKYALSKIILIIISFILLFLIIWLGFWSVCSNRLILLKAFLIFNVSYLLGLLILTISLIVTDIFVKELIVKLLKNAIKQYQIERNYEIIKFINQLQSSMHCCGVNDYKDWQRITLPTSCCSSSKNSECIQNSSKLYLKGCGGAVNKLMSNHLNCFLKQIICVFISLGFTSTFTSILIYRRIKLRGFLPL